MAVAQTARRPGLLITAYAFRSRLLCICDLNLARARFLNFDVGRWGEVACSIGLRGVALCVSPWITLGRAGTKGTGVADNQARKKGHE